MPRIARVAPQAAAETDTRSAILDAAERQLRRFGPEKLTVLDIAREAGMSHPNLYRFFASKSDILEAVVARWLGTVEAPLIAIANGPGSAAERLRRCMLELHRIKACKVTEEAEMFRCYGSLLNLVGREAIAAHVAVLRDLLRQLIAEGMASGEFSSRLNALETAETLREATISFHNPTLLPGVLEQGGAQGRLERLADLLIAGLRP